MSFRSYFFPQKILETSSPFNTRIRVNEEWGKMKLLVDGSPQSGSYIASLWKKAFVRFSVIPTYPVREILVLGVGGGTVIELLHDEFPHASILGVDIDPVILDIAARYFHVDAIPGVVLVRADAQKHIRKSVVQKKTYDIIVVDLFTGFRIPEFVATEVFLSDLKKSFTKNGFVLINYLRELEYREKSDELMETLQKVFPTVRDFETANNRFFCTR